MTTIRASKGARKDSAVSDWGATRGHTGALSKLSLTELIAMLVVEVGTSANPDYDPDVQ